MSLTDRVFRARRDILAGELVTLEDLEQAPLGTEIDSPTRYVEIPHPDMNVGVVITPDITLEEAAQAIAQLQSPTGVTVPLTIPPSVKTAEDFFGPDMGESIANQLADRIYGVDCSRCGTATKKPVDVGARKLCAECAALEY